MLYYERKFKKIGKNLIIGVDEAGRGPLAGPVVAAAVVLKTHSFENRIDDSKKLTPHQRTNAFFEITSKALYSTAILNERVIDRLNILVATEIAMEQAIDNLFVKLGRVDKQKLQVLVDGRMRLNTSLPYMSIVRGDSRCQSIAAASIIAKVTRDRIMNLYHRAFPQYGFDRHKGYPTFAHRQALKDFGRCIIHRETFCGV